MFAHIAGLVDRLESQKVVEAGALSWASPVPFFGDIARATVVTVGLNPSSREFLDSDGEELVGPSRRFHTLSSLGLQSWSEADVGHLHRILATCRSYFMGNPYNHWFGRLDKLIRGTSRSYYRLCRAACHLDVVPYATLPKWAELTHQQRSVLLRVGTGALADMLWRSRAIVALLNGQSVVDCFQEATGVELRRRAMRRWELPRRSGRNVPGFAFEGIVDRLCGVKLDREILVLGFNHNIQSSFGVTNEVAQAIASWFERRSRAVVS